MRLYLIVVILLSSFHSISQQRSTDIESFIENLVAIPSVDVDHTELYETLLGYYNHPLNLNEASYEQLASLYVLSIVQINELLKHLEQNGPLLSLYELQTIPFFDKKTISNLVLFSTVAPKTIELTKFASTDLLAKGYNQLIIRYEQTLERRKGFKPTILNTDSTLSNAYVGSPARYNLRFRSQKVKKYRFGVSIEKDAGEALAWDAKRSVYGVDNYNLYFQVFNKGRLKSLIIGDYQLQFGQGLLLGGGFSLGKGAETITTVKRPQTGIRAHTSLLETGFLRGIASTYSPIKNIDVTGFYSSTNEDAILISDSLVSDIPFIRSIQTSGLHRTQSETRSQNTLRKKSFGGNITYRKRGVEIGITNVVNKLSHPIVRNNTLANQFRFNGDFNHNVGVNINYQWQNFAFFSEAARSSSGGYGMIGGFISSLSKPLSLSLLIRNYQRNFHSLLGQSFAESSGDNINEQGIYLGFRYEFNRKYQLSGYFDQFKFPWVQTRVNRPSNGYEYLFRGEYTPNKSTHLALQFRQESKARNISNESNIIVAEQGIKNSYLINFDHKLSERSGFKTRVQFSNYSLNSNHTAGFVLAQDFYWNFNRFKLSGRLALFDADDFENRQYVYERDVLYSFSLPAYNGTGSRRYLLLQYKFLRNLTAWVRWANTRFSNQEVISSGQQEIEGSSQNDIKVQLQLKF